MNAFDVVKDFELALGEYTGAPYVVAVNSCTAALRLALMWDKLKYGNTRVFVPCRTYPSVPMAVKWARRHISFHDIAWEGVYSLIPTMILDCAKRFKKGMHEGYQVQCVSFHPQKPLSISTGGGAILHDEPESDPWYRRMRFDGRTEGVPTRDDEYTMIGEHCYMFPSQAAEGLHRLSIYAQTEHEDMPAELDKYPDLSTWEVFK